MNTGVFYQYLETEQGILEVIASKKGICRIGFIDKPQPGRANNLTQQAISQLREYFAGSRREFRLPLAATGTAFQQQVWQQLATIPYGQCCSYQDIAKRIGNPNAVRAVGAANGKNPIAIVVPCHRVIGKNGTLTGYAGGLTRKAWLLKLEQQALAKAHE